MLFRSGSEGVSESGAAGSWVANAVICAGNSVSSEVSEGNGVDLVVAVPHLGNIGNVEGHISEIEGNANSGGSCDGSTSSFEVTAAVEAWA